MRESYDALRRKLYGMLQCLGIVTSVDFLHGELQHGMDINSTVDQYNTAVYY
jgi:hypothetical protein